MRKTLVAYYTQTGNTRQVAEAILEALSGDKILLPIRDVADLEPFRLIFAGFPVHGHSVPMPVEEFLRRIPAGRELALFSTHGSVAGSPLSKEALVHASVVAARARLLGTYSCRGRVSERAREVFSRSPEHDAWADMAASAAVHPNAHDLAEARAFARLIQSKSGHASG